MKKEKKETLIKIKEVNGCYEGTISGRLIDLSEMMASVMYDNKDFSAIVFKAISLYADDAAERNGLEE